MSRHSLIAIPAAALLAMTSGHVAAQSNEYRLNEQGDWTQTASPAPATDEGIVAEARRALALDEPGRAKSLLDSWLETHKNTDSPLLAEAYLLRGDARTAAGNEYKALYDYETVIREFSASPHYVTAVERELAIGLRYLAGMNYKKWGLRVWGARAIGEELLIRVQERMPGSAVAERAGIELADYYYSKRDLDLAGQAYDLFLQNYPRSERADKAMKRRVYSAVGQYKGPKYDGSSLADAEVLIRRYAALYPAEAERVGLNDALVVRLDESAAVEMLDMARWYLRQDDLASARYTLTRLLQSHPRTAAADRAADILAERGWTTGLESPTSPENSTGANRAAEPPIAIDEPATPEKPAVEPAQPKPVQAPDQPAEEPAPPQAEPAPPPVEPAPPETPKEPKPGFTPGTPVRKPGTPPPNPDKPGAPS